MQRQSTKHSDLTRKTTVAKLTINNYEIFNVTFYPGHFSVPSGNPPEQLILGNYSNTRHACGISARACAELQLCVRSFQRSF